MTDMDSLRVAVTEWDRPASYFKARTTVDMDAVEAMASAGRAVLQSKEIWECEEHSSFSDDKYTCEYAEYAPATTAACSMVQRRLLVSDF